MCRGRARSLFHSGLESNGRCPGNCRFQSALCAGQIGPFTKVNDILDRNVACVRLHAEVTVLGEKNDIAIEMYGITFHDSRA